MSETTETTAPQLPPGMTDSERFRANETVERTDSRGRKLSIKQLSLLEEMGLLAVAGARNENRRWMMYATLAFCVRMIDGIPVPPVANENQLSNRISRVDAEGVAAVAALLAEAAPAADEDVDETPFAASTIDAAKN